MSTLFTFFMFPEELCEFLRSASSLPADERNLVARRVWLTYLQLFQNAYKLYCQNFSEFDSFMLGSFSRPWIKAMQRVRDMLPAEGPHNSAYAKASEDVKTFKEDPLDFCLWIEDVDFREPSTSSTDLSSLST